MKIRGDGGGVSGGPGFRDADPGAGQREWLVLETMGLEGELDMEGVAGELAPLLRAMDEAEGTPPDPERFPPGGSLAPTSCPCCVPLVMDSAAPSSQLAGRMREPFPPQRA